MKRIRILLCLLLALCVLLPCLPAALADEPAEGDDERFAGKTWEEVVADFLAKWGTDEKRITLGYYNTVTGEEHYLNPDQYMVSGSMYKVPLNMLYLEKLTNGEIDWNTKIAGVTYEALLEGTIVHSSNPYARFMWKHLGSYRTYRRLIAPIMGVDPDTVEAKYYENNFFTARQMIFCLRTLYDNQETYPRLIESMQRAQPDQYFKRDERRFDIAQKYGYLSDKGHLYMTDCAICYTDDPILIVMFTDNVNKAYDVMAEYCTLMCDYTQYHTAIRVEEEKAEAERQRLEEEARRAEEERQAKLSQEASKEAAREAERILQEDHDPNGGTGGDEAPDRESGPVVTRLVRRAEQRGLSRTALMAAAAAILASFLVTVVLAVQGKKYRVRVRYAVGVAVLLCLAALLRMGWPAVEHLRNRPDGDPRETVQEFIDALEQQDYARAYACLDGVETLGLEYEPEAESSRAILTALREQFSGQLYGECTVDGDRAYQQLACTYFDVGALEWQARSEAMLEISRYAGTHPVSELYDENNNYRPELLREAWDHAVAVLLDQPGDFVRSGSVQLELCWHDGAWHIVPSEKLLTLLCGGLEFTGEEGRS